MCVYVRIHGTRVHMHVHTYLILCLIAINLRMYNPFMYDYRMVLDGWPQTKSQVELLRKHYILPMIFIELKVSEDECITRAYSQRLCRKR